MFNWFKKTKSWVRFYSMDQNVSIMYPVVDTRLTDRDWNNVGDI